MYYVFIYIYMYVYIIYICIIIYSIYNIYIYCIYIYIYIYICIYAYIHIFYRYRFIYDSQIVHHNPCFDLFILHDNSFDKQGSEINKNDIFLRFDILSIYKKFLPTTHSINLYLAIIGLVLDFACN